MAGIRFLGKSRADLGGRACCARDIVLGQAKVHTEEAARCVCVTDEDTIERNDSRVYGPVAP